MTHHLVSAPSYPGTPAVPGNLAPGNSYGQGCSIASSCTGPSTASSMTTSEDCRRADSTEMWQRTTFTPIEEVFTETMTEGLPASANDNFYNGDSRGMDGAGFTHTGVESQGFGAASSSYGFDSGHRRDYGISTAVHNPLPTHAPQGTLGMHGFPFFQPVVQAQPDFALPPMVTYLLHHEPLSAS